MYFQVHPDSHPVVCGGVSKDLTWDYDHTVAAVIFPLMLFLNCCRYICLVRKSYQENDSVISTITTKVKGFAFTNTSDMDARLWDVADYVIPPQVGIILFCSLLMTPNDNLMFPQGADSFFVLTNMVITANQTQSRCPAVSD